MPQDTNPKRTVVGKVILTLIIVLLVCGTAGLVAIHLVHATARQTLAIAAGALVCMIIGMGIDAFLRSDD